MYCPYCGAKINIHLQECPYCRADINEAVAHEKKRIADKLAADLPDFSRISSSEFSFGENTIQFSESYIKLVSIKKFFDSITVTNLKDFSVRISRLRNYNLYVKAIDRTAYELMERSAVIASELLKQFGMETTAKELLDGFPYSFYDNTITEIESAMREIDGYNSGATKAAIDEFSSNFGKRNVNWVGGGFGIKGAIKGTVQASILNAGATAVHSAGSILSFGISSVKNSISAANLKNKFMEDSELQKFICNGFKYCCNNFAMYICYLADREAMEKAAQYREDCKKRFEDVSDSYVRGKKDASENEINELHQKMIKLDCDCIEKYPFEISYYENLYGMTVGDEKIKAFKLAEAAFDLTQNAIGFLNYDWDMIDQNSYALDDEPEDAEKKIAALMRLAEAIPLYSRPKYAELVTNSNSSSNIRVLRDNLIRCWLQIDKMPRLTELLEIMDEYLKSKEKWTYAQKYPELACHWYMEIRGKLGSFKLSVARFLKNCESLVAGIKAGSEISKRIYTYVYTEYLIANNMEYNHYIELVNSYAINGDALASAVLGEWYNRGIGKITKNEYIAEQYYRRALIGYNTLGIANIGIFYKYGKAGYKKDTALAEEMLMYAAGLNIPVARIELGI